MILINTTPGREVSVTHSGDDPKSGDSVSFAVQAKGGAININYPAVHQAVPITSGQVEVGVGGPAGASGMVVHTFDPICK